MNEIKKQLSFLSRELVDELLQHSEIRQIPGDTEILKEEQYVKMLPVVLSGLIKVYSRFEERELLLYYIEPNQSCVMSFAAALRNRPSRVIAATVEDSEVLLIPSSKIPQWLRNYPDFQNLFYEQYDLRYAELLDTIQHILINKMDKRLYDYLLARSKVLNRKEFKISHGQIAAELGTAREVISRVMKKLEYEEKIVQENNMIKIL